MLKLALDPAMLSNRPVEAWPEAVAAAGYEYMEIVNRDDFIGAFGPPKATTTELAAVRSSAQSEGVEVASVAVIQAWSDPDPDRRRQAMRWWRDGLEAVLTLGVRRINSELSGDPNRPTECLAAYRRSLEELLPVWEDAGVVVAVEPHPYDFVESTAAAVDIVTSVDSPHLRYLHCAPHEFYLGGSQAEQVAYARDVVAHVHIADSARPDRIIVNPQGADVRTHQHIDIGEGEVDLQGLAAALGVIGYDDIVTVQVFAWADRAIDSFRVNRQRVEPLLNTIRAGAA